MGAGIHGTVSAVSKLDISYTSERSAVLVKRCLLKKIKFLLMTPMGDAMLKCAKLQLEFRKSRNSKSTDTNNM